MTAPAHPVTPTGVAPLPQATILGYPRIGRRRELKRAVEAFWKGKISEEQLRVTARELRAATRARLVELGLPATGGAVPESFSFYDQVLDATLALGAIPSRFADVAETGSDLASYFALARGDESHQPLEMTKWFDTNYHYSVPELSAATPLAANAAALVAQLAEAAEQGIESRPVLVGPVTYLLLAKAADDAAEGFAPIDRLDEVVAVYGELLAALAAAGARWVQLDEPALVSDSLSVPRAEVLALVERAYTTLGAPAVGAARPAILLTAPYGDSSAALTRLGALPVEAVQADLVRGTLPEEALADGSLAAAFAGTQLVAGVVDGRNIWRTDLRAALALAQRISDAGIATVIGTSNSLQHVPHDVADETKLDARLASWLAFADQKVTQVATLARGLAEGAAAIEAELADTEAALADRAGAPGVRDARVRERAAAVTSADRSRADEGARRDAQRGIGVPELATTTIGSFPQTTEIRTARAAFVRGEIDQAAYDGFLREEIARVIRLQEEIGLDVLVHGEAERNDMVQYFAELLDGFAVTENGWVQSYGTRATRPSILWGDVSRPAPMTVAWSAYAQSLTEKPVKGMLTGPVTILAWSFVRDDQPLADTAEQVALALRDEIDDLVAAGITIVQVDEPALRELLPLDADRQAAYLDWSVGSFRLATSGAASEVQIHTHLCYSEFGEIIGAVDGLDADVTSIEAARSRMDVVDPLGDHGYSRGIGPGVYDIHSPRVPSAAEQEELIRIAAARIPGEQLWVNPDCGLKTRGYEETVASLTNLVQAARAVRGA
ncbi:5-methyltetrahydropteroyltriglutamate--homocysteine S-methyltransferase [Leucobacter chromiireducens]|uniref:5-methyltetrahydropteroyltriglutamate--homocysteine S-methyltransferase n=1 Tax=Leucobacter chromiireducens subsp. chromiireducens TaxID=660067 RepID=A0ABS1SQV7_9MICO|nr:5-methyltetrahydropteroyltriglutamate--homocysteine S-methyltransferase [Leucobacter chromiireducens]MBL3689271.1 5-methyltetrahydropteroyltriglutamate--homocysteine S-methyltransferase [Leucobacter chromiireducens subsp. chromiireducens]